MQKKKKKKYLHAFGTTFLTLDWSRKRRKKKKKLKRCIETFPGEKQKTETKTSPLLIENLNLFSIIL